jgi:hypothetical protein
VRTGTHHNILFYDANSQPSNTADFSVHSDASLLIHTVHNLQLTTYNLLLQLQLQLQLHYYYHIIMSSSSSSSMLLMAGSVVLVAAAATQFFPKSSKSSTGITDIDDDEDMIDEDLVCKVFDRLYLEMQNVVAQLGQQVQQIQMSGQQIPEAQLRKLLKVEFERALLLRQVKVYEDHNVDADCLEEATWEFVADENQKVKQAVERFQKLYEQISGETVVGRRPGVAVEVKEAKILTGEKTIEAATVYFGALSDAMKGIVDEFKAEGKNLSDPAVTQELQIKFGSIANSAGDACLAKIGLTLRDFQASVEANSSNPEVARSLAMLQMQQQKEMMEMTGGGGAV